MDTQERWLHHWFLLPILKIAKMNFLCSAPVPVPWGVLVGKTLNLRLPFLNVKLCCWSSLSHLWLLAQHHCIESWGGHVRACKTFHMSINIQLQAWLFHKAAWKLYLFYLIEIFLLIIIDSHAVGMVKRSLYTLSVFLLMVTSGKTTEQRHNQDTGIGIIQSTQVVPLLPLTHLCVD